MVKQIALIYRNEGRRKNMKVIKRPIINIDKCFLGCGSKDNHPNCQCKREN